jgi:hypothetical protein
MLKQIYDYLIKANLDASLEAKSQALPYDRLLVFLGADYKNRERILEITSQDQQLNQNLADSSAIKDSYYRIQFHIPLAFKVQDLAIGQVSSLLLFLNQMLDFPGLELNELENQVSYRYILLAKDKGIDELLINSLIGIVLLILDLFTETIEYLAQGKSTFNELLEEIIKIADHVKQPNI